MGKGVGRWPTLSGPTKDGSRHIGLRVLPDARAQLEARGFVVANQLVTRTVDNAHLTSVRMGDVLDVRFDGDRGWWVWRGEDRLGRLSWSASTFEQRPWRDTATPRIDDGTIQVIRLVLDVRGVVVNAGGIVRPKGERVPSLDDAVPEADVYVPSLMATIGPDADVTVTAANMPGSQRVGSKASHEEVARKGRGFLRRLLGR